MSLTHKSRETNFAARILERLTPHSALIDAASGNAALGDELRARVAGFAAQFLAAGLRSGDRLVIGCSLTIDAALAYFGAILAGIVPVTVDERMLASSGVALCVKAKASAIWMGSEVRFDSVLDNAIAVLRGPAAPVSPRSIVAAPVVEEDLAVLVPTSGSTGVPRLVMVTHGNLIANTEAIIRSQRLGHDERAMLVLPFSYCFGASVLHTHLYQGGSVAFDSRFMFPDRVLRAIETYSCTTFAGVPTVYHILLRRSNLRSIRFPKLRRCLQAGGALGPREIREMCQTLPEAEFFVMYGQTEATSRISCFATRHNQDHLGTVGRPLDNLELCISDEHGRKLPAGRTGEIRVRGPSVCAGYFDDADAGAHRFASGWLLTGDLGSLDDQGYLTIEGRAGDFLKIRGVRVSLGEIESAVSSVGGVFECAATSQYHPEAGEALALFIVPEKEADGLVEKVRKALPPHWTCASVSIVTDLPRTTNGKVARAQLRSIA